MPQSTSATARAAGLLSAGSVRWDRIARPLVFFGLAVVAIFYASSLIGLVGTALDSSDQTSRLEQLKHDNATLIAKRKALQGAGGIEVEARRLGMVKPGEVPVVVTGLRGSGNR